ncbi:MAG: hypothetical protein Q9173_005895 [Seirophora scorigena]
MHIKCAALTALGALAAVTLATPVASPQESSDIADSAGAVAPGEFHELSGPAPADFSAQAITYLYVCTDANFRGRCQNLQSTRQGCSTPSPRSAPPEAQRAPSGSYSLLPLFPFSFFPMSPDHVYNSSVGNLNSATVQRDVLCEITELERQLTISALENMVLV